MTALTDSFSLPGCQYHALGEGGAVNARADGRITVQGGAA